MESIDGPRKIERRETKTFHHASLPRTEPPFSYELLNKSSKEEDELTASKTFSKRISKKGEMSRRNSGTAATPVVARHIFTRKVSTLPSPPLDEPTKAAIAEGKQQALTVGSLSDRGIANAQIGEFCCIEQFNRYFDPLVETCGGPRAFCGVAAPVLAFQLCDALDKLGWPNRLSHEQVLTELASATCQLVEFTKRVEEGLIWLKNSRTMDIARHKELRDSASEQKNYYKAWTANYELSDLLLHWNEQRQSRNKSDVSSRTPPNGLLYIRANEMPELGKATFEERRRMLSEQARFGGKAVASSTTGEVVVNYGADGTSVIVDTCRRRSSDGQALLMKTSEFLDEERVRMYNAGKGFLPDGDAATMPKQKVIDVDAESTASQPDAREDDAAQKQAVIDWASRPCHTRVMIVDQQGHYAVQLFYVTPEGCPSSMIFNTLKHDADLPIPWGSVAAHEIGAAATFL